MTTTMLDTPAGLSFEGETTDGDVKYAELCTSLRRCRDFCIVLALVVFFGRSTWAWLGGRSWIVGPNLAGLYVVGFPALFLIFGGRDLCAWFRLWRARLLPHAHRREGSKRPWQYVTAGAVLGASSVLMVAAILRILSLRAQGSGPRAVQGLRPGP